MKLEREVQNAKKGMKRSTLDFARNQCDKIWRIFALLAIFLTLGAFFTAKYRPMIL
jgi:hypothetical protein